MLGGVDDNRVFRALADPTRRHLLDRLFERDGRTLTELVEDVEMSRFGVMKHLRVLEGAGMIVTRRARSREAPLPQCRPGPTDRRPLGR